MGQTLGDGDRPINEHVSTTVYSKLRAIAQNQMNQERSGHTLTATALVHEAYMRLSSDERIAALGRTAFVRAAAEAMRRILVEHARSRGRVKRGGRVARESLDQMGEVADLAWADDDRAEDLLAFDDAFRRLEAHDEDVADVVRLRYFGGMTVEETATALGVSERTVNYRWTYARAWLAREVHAARGQNG